MQLKIFYNNVVSILGKQISFRKHNFPSSNSGQEHCEDII